jgi:hypothetical protein
VNPLRSTRRSGLLLALACCLGLLAPAGAVAGPPAAGAAVNPALTGAAAGGGQDLLREPGGPQLGSATRRDERERPGPALPGLLASAPVLASALAAVWRGGRRPGRRGFGTAAARAPPSLRLATS